MNMRKVTVNRFAGTITFICLGLAQTALADDALTARNKAIVREFYTTVLINRQVDAAPQFLRADYIQHNPNVPTGLKRFMDAFRERFAQKLPPDYKRELLNVVGDNDMVVIRSDFLLILSSSNQVLPANPALCCKLSIMRCRTLKVLGGSALSR
jgi:predicted SnoaL-like aldol condensation-catalyzing enzyme